MMLRLIVVLAIVAMGCREGSYDAVASGLPAAAIDWVRAPAGSFEMGSPAGEAGRDTDEGPLRRVDLEAFEIANTEVTVAQYRACVEAGACSDAKGDYRCNYRVPGQDDYPVVCVTLEQAQTYSRWVGGALPSEAQWEYAARAGATGALYGDLDEIAWWRGNAEARPHPVGLREPNAWGLYDVVGNVWELVGDQWHGGYEGGPTDGSVWLTDLEDHWAWVARGGCWVDHSAWVRLGSRYVFAGSQRGITGFRPVRPVR